MTSVNMKVVSYCEIPEELAELSWLNNYPNGCYVEYKLNKLGIDEISDWLRAKYPELEQEDKFLIEIDY